jgi:hypothetical protein
MGTRSSAARGPFWADNLRTGSDHAVKIGDVAMKNSILILQGAIKAPNGIKHNEKNRRCYFTVQSDGDHFFCQADEIGLNDLCLEHGMGVRLLGYLKSFLRNQQRSTYVEVIAIRRMKNREDIWDNQAVPLLLKAAFDDRPNKPADKN